MNYYAIYLRNTPEPYTWESERDIAVGARVEVFFRGKPKFGIVLHKTTEKPDFKTQKIREVLDEDFLDERYIDLALQIAEENFCSPAKVLNLMIPELFFLRKNPVKYDIFYSLGSEFSDETFQKIRGTKQKAVLQKISQEKTVSEENIRGIASVNTLKTLESKGFIEQKKCSIKTVQKPLKNKKQSHNLNNLQKNIFADVMTSKTPGLIWGVTGSGKTEIYKKISQDFLERHDKNQVLFLIPEIALTPQMIDEFRSLFGENVAVWHSHLTSQEKVQEWARLHSGDARILIGTRSAVLVPLKNPSLIIMDEEHEWTFKNEFAPRYQTHNVVQKISGIFGSKLVFGSATPRTESLHQCQKNSWDLFEIQEKVHQTIPPKIEILNLENEGKKGNNSPISEKLLAEIKRTVSKKEQVVLFLNKRGYAGSTMCKSCGHFFECPNCSANMKLHRSGANQKFICHICGHFEKFPEICPHCQAEDFVFRGWGTQQVEKYLTEALPNIRTIRADRDTVSGKYDFEKILSKFHNHEADILLGTQMIAKGLDFERVTLAGVVLADVGLGLPDFRAEERVFQILTQVSGRAGRRKIPGKILIQTFHPDHQVFQHIRNNDPKGFYNATMSTREKLLLPPFSHFAKITFSNVSKEIALKKSQEFFKVLKKSQEESSDILEISFAPAFFPRIHNKYHFHIIVKGKRKDDLQKFLRNFEIPKEAKIDIDPSSLL